MSTLENDDHPLEDEYPDAETLEEETPGFEKPEDEDLLEDDEED